MKFRKQLVAVILALMVFFSFGVTAYAEEIPTTTTEEPTQGEIEQSTSNPEDDDLPPAEDPPVGEEQGVTPVPVTVFSLEELNAAVDAAEDGDTVLVATPITISTDTIIGTADKTIVLKPSEEYKPNGLFDYSSLNNNNVTLQNLVMDGTQTDWQMKAAVIYSRYATGEKSVWNFENVIFKNLNCTESAVVVRNADAHFENCEFIGNYGMMGGALNIESGCRSEVSNCKFIGNKANINGGAIYCFGEADISNCTITDNMTINEDSALGYGGGVFVAWNGNCNVTASEITGNKANYGGGIYGEGINTFVDTRIYSNSAELGGDDIYCSSNFRISVGYTDDMNAIFTVESKAVGFFLDNQGTRFDSTTNANMLGKSIDVRSSQIGLIGLKFIFQSDLPSMPEAPALVVNTLNDLQTAIANASNGDVIYVSNKMICTESAVIGSPDKTVTLKVADSFISDTLFYLSNNTDQTYTFQNLILSGDQIEGKSVFAITAPISLSATEISGSWIFENVTFEKFNSNGSVVTVPSGISATFTNCSFENNYGRRSGGIEISANSLMEIKNCSFTDNQSIGDGAAIRCCGQATISNSTITGNTAINDGIVRNGGGVYVGTGASCEMQSCTVRENTADLGGGIACSGTLRLCDTLVYGNTGNLGGSDIRGYSGSNIEVEYTDSMSAVYTENDPVGFYKDDFESPFNAEINAVFVGETLTLQSNDNNNFGVKFIFKADLPVVTPAPDDNSDNPPEDDLPSEDDGENEAIKWPIISVVPPVIEVDPNPVPDPTPTPTPEPIPTQPIDPPEENENADIEETVPSETEKEQSVPVVGEDGAEQEGMETVPPVSATDDIPSGGTESEQDTTPIQEETEDASVDLPAHSVDEHTETEVSELPIVDDAPTATVQPEQEERSTPWGVIIAITALLPVSGAIWLIKRKR